jgi:hypothetical protein
VIVASPLPRSGLFSFRRPLACRPVAPLGSAPLVRQIITIRNAARDDTIIVRH